MIRRIGGEAAPVAAAAVTIALVWQIASLFFPDFLMPGILATLGRARSLVSDRGFYQNLLSSFSRLAGGYGIAVLVGIAGGLAGGTMSWLGKYLRALVSILQSIPPITWVPLLVLLVGFGSVPIVATVAIASAFPLLLNVMNAAQGVSNTRVQVARLFGAGLPRQIQKVYFPEILPGILTGMQIAFGNAWRSMVAAEMVAGVSTGLGWAISYSGEIADMPAVLLYMVTIGTVATIFDKQVFERVARIALRYRYSDEGENP